MSVITRTALALSLTALASCGAPSGAQNQGPPPPAVEVAPPRVADVPVWEELVGRFRAVETVEVRPQATGRLVKVHFVDGQNVRQGDPLFTIDQRPAAAFADQARAQAAQAKAQLALAESELARAERLRALDAISEEEFDQRRQAALQAKASVNAAAAAQRAAEVDLGYTVVRSPISGRVSDRRVDPGNTVIANQTLMTSVVSQGPIHFEFSADPGVAQDLPRPNSKTGAVVELQLEGETGFPHRGRLDFIDNQIDPRTGVVRGRAVFNNSDGKFLAGQFGRIRVSRGSLDDALLVPETAISSDQTRKYVLVAQDDPQTKMTVAAPAPVELGPKLADQRVVRGLDPKARVIVSGGARVFPGMPITIEGASAQKQPPSDG